MACFQMDKNEKRELKSETDFDAMALSCKRDANEYCDLVMCSIKICFSACCNALTVNAAFACELYIKALIIYHDKKSVKGHNLTDLFNEMDEEIQNKVKEKFPYGNIAKSDFDLNLCEVSKAFEVSRYGYEYKEMACNMLFILELMGTLAEICNYVIK